MASAVAGSNYGGRNSMGKKSSTSSSSSSQKGGKGSTTTTTTTATTSSSTTTKSHKRSTNNSSSLTNTTSGRRPPVDWRKYRMPKDYIYDPRRAEPVLSELQRVRDERKRRMHDNHKHGQDFRSSGGGGGDDEEDNLSSTLGGVPSAKLLDELLEAARRDVRLHRRRQKAVIRNDPSLLSGGLDDHTHADDDDDRGLQEIFQSHADKVEALRTQTSLNNSQSITTINNSKSQNSNNSNNSTLTKQWEEALECYVYAASPKRPSENEGSNGTIGTGTGVSLPSASTSALASGSALPPMDLLSLLELLCTSCRSEPELLSALSSASTACTSLVEQTSTLVSQISQVAEVVEDGHGATLEAFHIYVRDFLSASCLQLEENFYKYGGPALSVGPQMERAEARRHCGTSTQELLEKWWFMEELSQVGGEVDVEEEVRGVTRNAAGNRLDELYTHPQRGLEAARVLRRLRMVASARRRHRGPTTGLDLTVGVNVNVNVNVNGKINVNGNITNDATATHNVSQTMERTRSLILRISDAVEKRLLNDFLRVYTRGGDYDFTLPPQQQNTHPNNKPYHCRPGTLDWLKLREIAEALMCFDNGRNLFKTYVQLVVSTRFPELFERDFYMEYDDDPHAVEEENDNNNNNNNNNHKNDDKTKKDNHNNHNDDDDDASESDLQFPTRKPHNNDKGKDKDDTDNQDDNENDNDNENDDEFDMDETRSLLSRLFYRVREVCTAEFELIAHVFSTSSTSSSLMESSPNDPHHNDPTKSSTTSSTSLSSSSSSSPLKTKADRFHQLDPVPLQVARSLLQRVVSDRKYGLQAKINDLLDSIDRRSDHEAGAKKLDTFVDIHEKAAHLFKQLRLAAETYLVPSSSSLSIPTNQTKANNNNNPNISNNPNNLSQDNYDYDYSLDVNYAQANAQAASSSLLHFLTAQEMALSEGHRRGYLNLELRLLHHQCCAGLDKVDAKMLQPRKPRSVVSGGLRGTMGLGSSHSQSSSPMKPTTSLSSATGSMDTHQQQQLQLQLQQQQPHVAIEYRAPIMPLDREYLVKGGIAKMLDTVLKGPVSLKPLMKAKDSLERARLMFGDGKGDRAGYYRTVQAIYLQMCDFYGISYLYPIIDALADLVDVQPPPDPPFLPMNEDKPYYLGVDKKFWQAIDRVHNAANTFDKELWSRPGRVYDCLGKPNTGPAANRRIRLFRVLEEKLEAAVSQALDTISRHAHWILVKGGEQMLATGGARLFQITGSLLPNGGGPYAIPSQSHLEASNSPAVASLTTCLQTQYASLKANLTAQNLLAFWTSLSERMYDILVSRLLQHYVVSTNGAIILSRDVEELRMVSMLDGQVHPHWDILKELLTLYMTPPETLRPMLEGVPGTSNTPGTTEDKAHAHTRGGGGGGLFGYAGREVSLVFLSRRADFKTKAHAGTPWKKSKWARDLFRELGVANDPTEGTLNIGLYAAEHYKNKYKKQQQQQQQQQQ